MQLVYTSFWNKKRFTFCYAVTKEVAEKKLQLLEEEKKEETQHK